MPSSEHSDGANSKAGPGRAARGVNKKRATPVQAERRRAQNRISQQCLREKNLAYVRHLENVTEALQASKDANNNDRYSMLLEVHLKVVDENRRLEEALFRLRKKLLSLSNSASSAAEDSIFDTLLGRENRPSGGDDSLDPSFDFSPEGSLPLEVTGNQHTPPPVDQTTTQGGTVYQDNMLGHNFDPCLQQDSNIGGLDELLSSNNTLAFENLTSIQLVPVPRAPLQNQDRLYITCTTTFSQTILSACKEWLQRTSSEQIPCPEIKERRIEDVSRAATHLLATRIGLESYIYGLNGALHIEKLFGWRLGANDRNIVPKPFRPTPLQTRRPQHLMGIDLFNWPEIRDQLLLEEPRLNVDSLMRDLTLHSVIEQPQHGVAVGIYDLFQNHIMPNKSKEIATPSELRLGKSWLFDPSWVFYDVDIKAHRFRGLTSDPLLEALVGELDRRVQSLRSGTSSGEIDLNWPRGDKFQRNEVALFFGLDNMSEWKLSKEFADKYPFLDCSSAISRFKTVPASSIFGAM